jgi:hypothetical protein
MDYLIIAGLIIVAFFIGRIYQAVKIVDILVRAHLAEELNERATSLEVFKLEIEEHQGTKFLYDSTAQEFICQGSTLEDLAKLFNERKQKSLGMLEYDNTSVYFIDGKVSDKIA